jgi:hypothetical protein
MRGLLTAALQTPFSLADAEAPQPVYVLGGVIAPAALSTACERQRSEPLAEPEPATAYAEFVGGLANGECVILLEHTPNLNLTDRFI